MRRMLYTDDHEAYRETVRIQRAQRMGLDHRNSLSHNENGASLMRTRPAQFELGPRLRGSYEVSLR